MNMTRYTTKILVPVMLSVPFLCMSVWAARLAALNDLPAMGCLAFAAFLVAGGCSIRAIVATSE